MRPASIGADRFALLAVAASTTVSAWGLSSMVQAECADYRKGLHIVSEIPLEEIYAQDMAVAGDRAVVTFGAAGLRIVDVSNSHSPAIAGSLDTPGGCLAVTAAGDFAYVADGFFGLQVVDISDPTSPTFTATLDTPGNTYDVVVADNLGYLADGLALSVVDLTNPSAPSLLGSVALPYVGKTLAIGGSYAYIGSDIFLQIVDISIPASPQLVNTIVMPAKSILIQDEYAYVTGNGSLKRLDLSNPTNPTVASSIQDLSGIAMRMAICSGVLFVSNDFDGAEGFDIGTAGTLPVVGRIAFSFEYSSLAIAASETTLYLANDRFCVVDARDPTSSKGVLVDTPGTARDVTAQGSNVYVADGSAGLAILDLTDPMAPSILGSVDTPGGGNAVTVQGAYGFVADGSAGLQVVDVSSPGNPSIVASLPLDGTVTQIAIHGTVVYLGQQVGFVTSTAIVDVSDPLAPVLVGSFGAGSRTLVQGDRLYTPSFQIWDVLNPTTPALVGQRGVHAPWDVAVSAGHAYVTDPGHRFLSVIDLANPINPALVGHLYFEGYAAAASGNYLYVSESDLRIIDITTPSSPRHVAMGLGGGARMVDLDIGDGFLCAAEGAEGVRVYPTQCAQPTDLGDGLPDRPRLFVSALPNPSFDGARITFELPTRAPAKLDVYDVSGRRIRGLFTNSSFNGRQTIHWDGRNDEGVVVASGVYVLRLSTWTSMTSARVVLVR